MMRKFLKWTGIVAAGIVALALLAILWIFIASGRELGAKHTVARGAMLTIPTDAASIVEGERLARISGCLHCHGDALGGQMVHDFPNIARFVAPNISGSLQDHDDAQLEALIRHGVKFDGTGMLFMPAEMYRHKRDEDVAKIIAYLRTVPRADGVGEQTLIRPIGRFLLAQGIFKTGPRAIETLPAPVKTFDAADPVSHGKHLVMNLCSECHAQTLEGIPMANSPPLSVAKAYSSEQFERLMRDGTGMGDRTFALMTPTSKARFSWLTAAEVDAIYAFLQARSQAAGATAIASRSRRTRVSR